MIWKLYDTNWRRVALSILLFVFAVVVILPEMSRIVQEATGYTITPDSEFFYNTSRLAQIKGMYNESGIKAYIITRFTYDLVWPIIYLFFMVNALGMMTMSFKRSWLLNSLYILPFIAVAFDLLENVICSLYLWGNTVTFLESLAVICSGLKWIVIISIFGVQALLLIYSSYKLIRKKLSN